MRGGVGGGSLQHRGIVRWSLSMFSRRNLLFCCLFVFAIVLIITYEYYAIRLMTIDKITPPKATNPTTPLEFQDQQSNKLNIVEEQPFQQVVVESTPKPFETLENTKAEISPRERRILPDPISLSYNIGPETPSVLIVGGTDGSGTRSVVQTLTDLGVSIVSEDPETFDIHADLVGGWPPIVKPVLHDVTNLRYQMINLKPQTRDFMSKSLERLLQQVKLDSTKPPSHRLAVGGRLPTPKDVYANHILYGFKAPVAMTLVPLWAHFLPRFIFLHVVRDGRDIAFSVNQGPVEKFYQDFYKTNTLGLDVPIKAIRLWSDWNSDIYEFAYNYYHSLQELQPSDKSFGYHVVHTEDLVQQSDHPAHIAIKFNAIYQLAQFVHSSLSNNQLCCLARRKNQFMGSHDRTPRKPQNSINNNGKVVTSRYGKWRRQVEKNPRLLSELLTYGKRGLKLFGYEPLRKLPQVDLTTEVANPIEEESRQSLIQYTTKDGYECILTDEQCREYYPESFTNNNNNDNNNQDKALKELSSYLGDGKCIGRKGIDYKGEDLKAETMDLWNDPSACCRLCKATAGCHHFTLDAYSGVCYLKFGNSQAVPNSRLISGSII